MENDSASVSLGRLLVYSPHANLGDGARSVWSPTGRFTHRPVLPEYLAASHPMQKTGSRLLSSTFGRLLRWADYPTGIPLENP